MKLPSIRDWRKSELSGKRVFVRVDFNVPVEGGRVRDETRIIASIPTIKYLRERGVKVIVASHLGRPKGKKEAKLSLRPIARAFGRLLNFPVSFIPEVVGPKVERAIAKMEAGEVLMLENLRFNSGEEKAAVAFARSLARLADFYVDDAFASAHRASASISLLPRYLPAAAGLLLEEEIVVLSRLLGKPKTPFFVLIGGAKVETKLGVIKAFLARATAVALGGSLVAPVLKTRGYAVGASPVSKEDLLVAKKIPKSKKLLLPLDVVVAAGPKGRPAVRAVTEIGAKEVIYDIGPETIRAYASLIKRARTIVWNGPLGWFENPKFSHGTKALAWIVAARSRGAAFGVAGGGETVEALRERGVAEWVDWVSTGGGAMLEFLEGKKLPGIQALKKRI